MKPIIFNTEMVRAILEGRKTVTRRVVKIPSNILLQDNGLYTLYTEGTCYENQDIEDLVLYLKPPYKLNDILYVRETWTDWGCYKCEAYECYGSCHLRKYLYKADGVIDEEKWRPSIHMPREAARIFLRVKSVRVERLHDMELEDFIAEGVSGVDELNYRFNFDVLWDSTIKKDQLEYYGYNANPYVWVIEFEEISKEEALDE